MASFLAGQRLPAGHLNALTSISVDLDVGGTYGTTETQVPGTLTIPAALIERMVVPSVNVHYFGASGNLIEVRVRQGATTGPIRARTRQPTHSLGSVTTATSGEGFLLAAGVTIDLIATLQLNGGTVDVAAYAGTNFLQATLLAAP